LAAMWDSDSKRRDLGLIMVIRRPRGLNEHYRKDRGTGHTVTFDVPLVVGPASRRRLGAPRVYRVWFQA
jgi:hypothetical protein